MKGASTICGCRRKASGRSAFAIASKSGPSGESCGRSISVKKGAVSVGS